MSNKNIILIVSLISAICTALTGQAHLFGDNLNHILAITGIIATAISGVLIKPDRDPESRDRVSDEKLKEINNA